VERAIEVLMGEHRLIEQALGSLETYAVEIRAGAPVLRDVIADYAAFLRGFADELHHGKEEDILFQRLIDRGFAREAVRSR
jgi:hemerythrin-like domain-containing protein